MIRMFLVFLLIFVAKYSQADVITGNFSNNQTSNPIMWNPVVSDTNGPQGFALQFRTGDAGGANTWRLSSFTINLANGGTNQASGIQASAFLYSWNTSNNSLTHRFTQSNMTASNSTLATGANAQFQFSLTDFNQLSSYALTSNTAYILGVNITQSTSESLSLMTYDPLNTAPTLPWTFDPGWSLGGNSDLLIPDTASGFVFTNSTSSVTDFDSLANGATVFSLGAVAVPEPGTFLMFGLALCLAGFFGFRIYIQKPGESIAAS